MRHDLAVHDRPVRRWLPLLALIGAAVAGIGLAAGDAAARATPDDRPAAIAHVDAPRLDTAADLHLIGAATTASVSAAGTIALGAGLALGRTRRTSGR